MKMKTERKKTAERKMTKTSTEKMAVKMKKIANKKHN
jgi:hypothetical protein